MAQALLIVEDDAEMRDLLAARLRRAGFDVTAVGSPSEAIQAAETQEFHVGLFDRQLAAGNGIQLMLELKSQMGHLQAVILSGHADQAFEDEALAHGAFAYLRKPCRLAHIEATVERAAVVAVAMLTGANP